MGIHCSRGRTPAARFAALILSAVVALGLLAVSGAARAGCYNDWDQGPFVYICSQPVVTMQAPASGTVVLPGTAVTITANASTASDPSFATLTRIEFFSGSTLIGTVNAPTGATSHTASISWTPPTAGSYSLSARAWDDGGSGGRAYEQMGNSATSTLIANAPPTAALSSPANGSVVAGPVGSVQINGAGTDPDGTVVRVELFANGALVSAADASQHQFTWTGVPAGTHSVFARAFDNRGVWRDSGAASVRVNALPTTSLSSPGGGAVFNGPSASIPMVASATDGDGAISRVDFLANGTVVGSATQAPYGFTWTNVPVGTHSLASRAVDSDGGVTASAAISVRVNALPTASLTQPAAGSTTRFPTPITFAASATDSDGSVTKVDFLVDGVQVGSVNAPAAFSLAWTPTAAGTFQVSARATDNNGQSGTSAPVSITVQPNALPTVSLTGPGDGFLTVPGASLTLTAAAADSDGSVSRVEFRANGSVIASDTTSPYSATWSNLAAGSYSVTARAIDNDGGVRDSAPITVNVAGPTAITPPGAFNSGGAIAGALADDFKVDPSGAAVYSVPIAIPPGTAGLVPALALSYSSRGGDGFIGHGWSLGGLSSISRCGRTRATDGLTSGVKAPVKLDATDQYCLDGQRLVLVSGTLGGNAEFRTEIDTFSKVQSFGTNPAKGPDRWEVRTKDGLLLTFGNTADSTFEAQGRSPTVVLSWLLNRVEDRRGNFYTAAYDKVAATGEIYPSVIRYTGNAAVPITPYHAVRFDYGVNPLTAGETERGDLQEGYVAGSRVSVRRRLDRIRVLIDTAADGSGGTVAHEYRIGYTQNPTNKRYLVQSLTHCSTNPQTPATVECLPATSFDYQQRTASHNNFSGTGSGAWGGAGLELPYELRNLTTSGGQNPRLYTEEANAWVAAKSVFADFDGDGRLDNAYSNGNGTWRVCLSRGNRFDCADWAGPAARSDAVLVGDFDGDGLGDVAVPPVTSQAGQMGAMTVCRSTGSGFTCAAWSGAFVVGDPNSWFSWSVQFGVGGSASPYKVLDINGDGRDDYLIFFGSAQACVSTGAGFQCSPFTGYEFTEGTKLCPTADGIPCFAGDRWTLGNAAGDMNGDGRIDFADNQGGSPNPVWRFCVTEDSGVSCISAANEVGDPSVNPAQVAVGGSFVAKFSHDDLGDLFVSRGGLSQLCRSTGLGFACTQIPPTGLDEGDYRVMSLGDFDGDGRPDAIGVNTTRNVIRVCQLGSSYQCADWTGPQIFPHLSMGVNITFWRLGDFNGDGRTDIATYDRTSDQWSVHLAAGPVPDLLLRVTTGVGERTEVDYSSLQDAATYVRDGAATYPLRNVQDGTLVVRQVRKDNGVGGFTSTTYSYGGAKTDLHGRGFLGFRWFYASDSASNVGTQTEVSQSFPTIGMPTLISATYVPNGREIKRIENRLTSTVTANAATTPKVYFPYIDRTVETTREINDGTNAVVRTETADPIVYDAYGNETSRTTTRVAGGQTYTETVASTNILNDVATWRLGLPEFVTVTRSAPGFTNVIRSRRFIYTAQGEIDTETVEDSGTADLKLGTKLNRDPATGVVTSRVLTWTELNTSTTGWTEDGTARTRAVETLGYDSRRRYPTTITNAANHTETRTYDQRSGQVASLTGPNALTTSWQFDGWGRRLRETRADGTYTTSTFSQCASNCGTAKMLVTTQTFNSSNQQITVPTVSYVDALGRAIRWQSWAFDGRERNGEKLFDAKGRLQSKTRTRFAGDAAVQTSYEYDDLGRTTAINDPTTGRSTIAYNGLTTTFTNSKSQTRTEVRNALGALRTVTDARSKVTSYTYEPFGNLATVTDAAGNVIRVVYDRLGRKTQLQDPNLGTWNYTVNALGEVRTQRDAKNQTIKLRYDVLGRLVHRLGPDQDHRFVFDTGTKGIGKLAEAATYTGTGTVDYRRLHTYDSFGRPQRTTVRLDVDFVTESSYDGNGRLSRVNHIRRTVGATSGGRTVGVDYAYTANGYLGQLRRADGAILWTVNEQDALDRVLQQTHGNGVRTRRNFHATRGLLMEIAAGPNGTVDRSVQNDAYTYDGIGNLTSRAQLNNSGGLISETFDYDALNRLTQTQVAGRSAVIIGYNDIGSITSKTGIGTYTYPASGATSVRPQAVSSISGTVAGISNPGFSYDANGNLISGLGRTVTWNGFNHPTQITKATGAGPGAASTGSVTHAFVYGPEYQRIRQTVTVSGGPIPGTTVHTYAGAIERETRTADNTTHVRTFLPQGVVLIDRYTSSTAAVTGAPAQQQIRYYQKDRLGSTVAVLNEAGTVLERQFYDPWGKRRNGDGSDSDTLRSLDHRYGYTEHEMLDATGLIHMNGRVYDPILGRFMSADPTVPDPSDGQNFNRYTYVLNNPHAYTDPSGFAQVRAAETATNVGSAFGLGIGGLDGSTMEVSLAQAMFNDEIAAWKEEEAALRIWAARVAEAEVAGRPISTGLLLAHANLFSSGLRIRLVHFARAFLAEKERVAREVAKVEQLGQGDQLQVQGSKIGLHKIFFASAGEGYSDGTYSILAASGRGRLDSLSSAEACKMLGECASVSPRELIFSLTTPLVLVLPPTSGAVLIAELGNGFYDLAAKGNPLTVVAVFTSELATGAAKEALSKSSSTRIGAVVGYAMQKLGDSAFERGPPIHPLDRSSQLRRCINGGGC